MMKTLAFFSPLSPLPSGVAHYADSLARRLAERWRLVFYIDGDYRPQTAVDLGEVKDHKQFRGEEDIFLFQASNGPMHAYMYPHILKHGGGVITLHDSTLYDMVMSYWEGRSRLKFWGDFMLNEGMSGIRRILEPLPGGGGKISERIFQHLYIEEESKRNSFTFLRRVVRHSKGIIAHSRWVEDAARRAGASCPIVTVPLAVEKAPPEISTDQARKTLNLERIGLGTRTFTALVYGYIQRHKRIEPILDAWSQFIRETPDAILLLIGPRSPDLDVDAAVAQRNLDDKVFVDASFVSSEKVLLYVFSADLCLNLRNPVYGSSSQTLMQILAAGRACVATDAETFSEFPDEVVKKITGGPQETLEILEALRWARDNAEERRNLGIRAREFVERGCLWSQVGEKYNEFLSDSV